MSQVCKRQDKNISNSLLQWHSICKTTKTSNYSFVSELTETTASVLYYNIVHFLLFVLFCFVYVNFVFIVLVFIVLFSVQLRVCSTTRWETSRTSTPWRSHQLAGPSPSGASSLPGRASGCCTRWSTCVVRRQRALCTCVLLSFLPHFSFSTSVPIAAPLPGGLLNQGWSDAV